MAAQPNKITDETRARLEADADRGQGGGVPRSVGPAERQELDGI